MVDGKKIAAIYNVWDGEELLEGSIRQIRPFVDFVIIIGQTYSNHGEYYNYSLHGISKIPIDRFIDFEPDLKLKPSENEKRKRQKGIEYAKKLNCNIVIQLDCDEYYQSESFERALKRFIKSDMDGSFCKLRTFYKEPTLQLVPAEDYYVPLFHKLTPETMTGVKYPVLVDPTRGLSSKTFLEFTRSEIEMFHYSFIRRDIGRKLRNSSARVNFEKDIDKHISQWWTAHAGSKIDYFGQDKELVEVKNHFNIQI